jgi:hypothetical protein
MYLKFISLNCLVKQIQFEWQQHVNLLDLIGESSYVLRIQDLAGFAETVSCSSMS